MDRNITKCVGLFVRVQPQTAELLDKISKASKRSKSHIVEDLIESKRLKFQKRKTF